MLDSSSRAKSALIMLLKEYDNTVPAGQVNKHNIKPVNSDFMILFLFMPKKM